MDFALNNLQRLIFHKTQTKQQPHTGFEFRSSSSFPMKILFFFFKIKFIVKEKQKNK